MTNHQQALNEIRNIFECGKYQYTMHGVEQRINRVIFRNEIEEAVASGSIIENYPEDKYGPSCLISGKTKAGRPLHIHVSMPLKVKIITVYEPDPEKWIDNRVRRR